MPHRQLDQQPASERLRDAVAERVFALPGLMEAPSAVSVPGARALVLTPASAAGPPEAFFAPGEFAHLHPATDQSLHLSLPLRLAAEACRAGWAEPHPLVVAGELPPTFVMVYAPRDEHELAVVVGLVEESYRFATGAAEPLSGTNADGQQCSRYSR